MKRFDPLWELVGHKRPLQGVEEDVDTACPVCHAVLHVGQDLAQGAAVECGLCGAQLVVSREGTPHVEIAPDELLEEDQEVPAAVQEPRGDLSEPPTDGP